MQVFLIGTPFETANELDSRRLNKQIIECKQILYAINRNSGAWANHPIVDMYKFHVDFLEYYLKTLELYRDGRLGESVKVSEIAMMCRPPFFEQGYLDNMKRRLYTKDKNFYSKWKYLGESDVNWYFGSDYQWRFYRNGKLVNIIPSGECRIIC